MGLDMFVYRVRKPQLEERVYTRKELDSKDLTAISVKNFECEESLLEQILPYAVTRDVTSEYINIEQIVKDYNLPKKSHVTMFSYDGIKVGGMNENKEYVDQFIDRNELYSKYVLNETEPTYIWCMEEEAYWRKHYELQDWFYEKLEHVENCGYYVLDAEQIAEMNAQFGEHVPEEDPTDDEALFYHEWY